MQKNPVRALRYAIEVPHGLGLHPLGGTEHPHVTQLEESLFYYWLLFHVPFHNPENHSSPNWNWHFFYCLQIGFLFLFSRDHCLVAVCSLAVLLAISCASLLYSALQRKISPCFHNSHHLNTSTPTYTVMFPGHSQVVLFQKLSCPSIFLSSE